jgi:hypothetical protein
MRAPGDTEGIAVTEDVNGADVRVNNEDASAGVNRNVMGCQQNSFPSVDKGDNVVPKRRQQRLPFYRFRSMGRRFIVLFDTLLGMKIDEIGNVDGARPPAGRVRGRRRAADVVATGSRRRSISSVGRVGITRRRRNRPSPSRKFWVIPCAKIFDNAWER